MDVQHHGQDRVALAVPVNDAVQDTAHAAGSFGNRFAVPMDKFEGREEVRVILDE